MPHETPVPNRVQGGVSSGEEDRDEPGNEGGRGGWLAWCRWRWSWLLLAVGLTTGLPLDGASARVDEKAVMATFMLHFVQFGTWPAEAFAGPQSPFRVGVIGADPLGSNLEAVFAGEKVRERGFEVRRYGPDESPDGCHLLFVGDLAPDKVSRLLGELAGKPVLTLSAQEDFCGRGGMVAFRMERGKVIFEVHREAVGRAGLKLHSRLLNLARIYPPREGAR